MTWYEKLQATRVALHDTPEMAIVFSEGKVAATEEFITTLIEQFPFVSEDYINFLRLVNGLQIDVCVLFGSGTTPFPSIFGAVNRWQDIIDISKVLPIGEDSTGSCFALNQKREIWRYDYDLPELINHNKLADTFPEFLNDVLMGQRFPDLFGDNWEYRTNSQWIFHMNNCGWFLKE
jgi:hypothetical protein